MTTGARPLVVALALTAILALYGWCYTLSIVHVAVAATIAAALCWGRTRAVAAAFVPITITFYIYDSLRVIAPRVVNRVIVAGVYDAERALFGVGDGDARRTLCEAALDIHLPWLDVTAGIVYSTHVLIVIGACLALLWATHRSAAADWRVPVFCWGFLVMNLIANAIQLAFPVAPPWYVIAHGMAPPTVMSPGNAAGLLRIDALLGFPHFEGIYRQGSLTFGAMPSLHVAFPTWVALNAATVKGRIAGACLALAMAFFAVYLQHHYILDVLAGAFLAVALFAILSRPPVRAKIVAFHRRLDGGAS